jgi:ATP synthase protein I
MTERNDKNQTSKLSDDLDDFDRRLSEKIAEHKGPEQKDNSGKNNPWSVSVRYGSGFAGGVLVGTGLGWYADKTFDSAPLGLLIGLFLGFAAGVRNIMREAAAHNAELAAESALVKDAPDENGTRNE